MKTKGCMFIALIVSGAAFGQQVTVKQEQSVKAEGKVQVKSASARAGVQSESKVEGSTNNTAQGGQHAGGASANGQGTAAVNTGATGNAGLQHASDGTLQTVVAPAISSEAGASGEATLIKRLETVAGAGDGSIKATQQAAAATEGALAQQLQTAVGTGAEGSVKATQQAAAATEGALAQQLQTAVGTGAEGSVKATQQAAAAAEGALAQQLQTAVGTSAEGSANATQHLQAVNDRLIKTGAAGKSTAASLNAAVNNTLKIKAMPVKINTRVISAAGLSLF